LKKTHKIRKLLKKLSVVKRQLKKVRASPYILMSYGSNFHP